MKKKLLIISIIMLSIPLMFSYFYIEKIFLDFRNRPAEYFIQYIIMVIPILITLVLFYFESKERKLSEEEQNKRLDDQNTHQINMQSSLERMSNILDVQSSKQEEISKCISTVAVDY